MTIIEAMTVIDLIDAMSNQFTNVDWKISQFIASNPNEFCSMTAAEIARRAGVSDASVIRFAQKIGFDGFQELRSRFKRELSKSNQPKTPDDALAQQASLIDSASTLLKEIDLASISQLANSAAACDTLIIVGSERSAHLAPLLANKFLSLEMKTVAIDNSQSIPLAANLTDAKSLLLVLDLAKNTEQLENCAVAACSRNAKIATISRHHASTLRNISDAYFFLPMTTGSNPPFPISFETMALLIGDLLFEALSRTRKEAQ